LCRIGLQKYKQNAVKHSSIKYLIKVYFLHCLIQRHVLALIMSHPQVDYFFIKAKYTISNPIVIV